MRNHHGRHIYVISSNHHKLNAWEPCSCQVKHATCYTHQFCQKPGPCRQPKKIPLLKFKCTLSQSWKPHLVMPNELCRHLHIWGCCVSVQKVASIAPGAVTFQPITARFLLGRPVNSSSSLRHPGLSLPTSTGTPTPSPPRRHVPRSPLIAPS